jgi:hypothetical protein
MMSNKRVLLKHDKPSTFSWKQALAHGCMFPDQFEAKEPTETQRAADSYAKRGRYMKDLGPSLEMPANHPQSCYCTRCRRYISVLWTKRFGNNQASRSPSPANRKRKAADLKSFRAAGGQVSRADRTEETKEEISGTRLSVQKVHRTEKTSEVHAQTTTEAKCIVETMEDGTKTVRRLHTTASMQRQSYTIKISEMVTHTHERFEETRRVKKQTLMRELLMAPDRRPDGSLRQVSALRRDMGQLYIKNNTQEPEEPPLIPENVWKNKNGSHQQRSRYKALVKQQQEAEARNNRRARDFQQRAYEVNRCNELQDEGDAKTALKELADRNNGFAAMLLGMEEGKLDERMQAMAEERMENHLPRNIRTPTSFKDFAIRGEQQEARIAAGESVVSGGEFWFYSKNVAFHRDQVPKALGRTALMLMMEKAEADSKDIQSAELKFRDMLDAHFADDVCLKPPEVHTVLDAFAAEFADVLHENWKDAEEPGAILHVPDVGHTFSRAVLAESMLSHTLTTYVPDFDSGRLKFITPKLNLLHRVLANNKQLKKHPWWDAIHKQYTELKGVARVIQHSSTIQQDDEPVDFMASNAAFTWS